MRKIKYLAASLALILLLVTALPLTVSAAPAGPIARDGTITIQPNSILALDAADFKAYKLFDVARVTGNATNGYQFGYEPVQAVKAFLMGLPSATAYGLTPADFPINAGNVDAKAEVFRKWLQDGYEETFDEDDIIALAKVMINSGAFSADAIPAAKIGQNIVFGDGSINPGLDYGYYLVTGAGKAHNDPVTPAEPHEGKVISRGMLVNVPELVYAANHAYDPDYVTGWTKDTVRKLKADAPKIDKKVWYHDNTNTGYPYNGTDAPASVAAPGWQDWTDVSIGDTVYFKHVSGVPDMTGYDIYQFIVHDYMSPGLTFDSGSVNVYIGGSTTPLNNTGNAYYTVDTDDVPTSTVKHPTAAYANGTYITINFKPEEFVKFTYNAAIVITYTAKLNERAVIGAGDLTPPGNPNKVWLEYSNNPNDGGGGSTGETPEDEVIVYTFDLKIFKYTGDLEQGELDEGYFVLPGAEFELRRKTGATTYGALLTFVKLPTGNPYDYRVAVAGDSPTTTILVSQADGYIRIKGLDAGVYELKETKAPVGYNLVPGYVTIIKIEHHDGTGGYKVYANGDETNVVNVENNTGGTLPGTGGIGLLIFLGVGSAMAVLLTVAYAIYRKKKILGTLKA